MRKQNVKKFGKSRKSWKTSKKRPPSIWGTYIVISDNDRQAVYGWFSRNTTGTHFFEKRTTPKSLILRENPKISPVFYENPHRKTTTPKSRGFFPWTPIEWWIFAPIPMDSEEAWSQTLTGQTHTTLPFEQCGVSGLCRDPCGTTIRPLTTNRERDWTGSSRVVAGIPEFPHNGRNSGIPDP